jgi:hypothetical protein
MSSFTKGFFITLFAAVILQGLIGLFFDGLSGVLDALMAMMFYWVVYFALAICVGLVGLMAHRRRHSSSKSPSI